jgi:hypothetical protein
LVTGLAGAVAASVPVPTEKASPIALPFVETRPTIDGKLDEDLWRSAAVFTGFYQVQPGDNIAPSQPTDVLMAYSARELFIAFRALDDDPGKIRVTVPKRDQIFDDDYVGIYLDTYDDRRRAYCFYLNPIGVQADGIVDQGGSEDFSLDVVFESKGEVGDTGYIVEMAMPFKSVRYAAGPGKHWGVHFFRRLQRFNNELDSWMPISRDIAGVLPQSGRVTGLDHIESVRSLEIIPSLTVSQTTRRVKAYTLAELIDDPAIVDPGRTINEPLNADFGLTLKYLITPAVTLDFAANPDFAQVEADQLVVTANLRFPVYYQEKRPFFLEGIDIFRTPVQVVHTRTIVDPDVAAKLTGKKGRTSFGFLVASDAAPGNFASEDLDDALVRESIEKYVDKNALVSVVRLKRDVGSSDSSLGFIATSYDFVEEHNYVAGVDGVLRVNPQTVLSFQAVGTASKSFFYEPETNSVDYRRGNGFAYEFAYDYTSKNFGCLARGEGATSDYRADVGFTRRVDTNHQVLFIRLSTDPKPAAPIISARWINLVRTNFDRSARLQDVVYESIANFDLQHQMGFEFGVVSGYSRIFEEEFGPKRNATQAGAFYGPDPERSTRPRGLWGNFQADPSERFGIFAWLGYTWGAFDFDFGAPPNYPRVSPAALADPLAPLDPGSGRELAGEISVSLRPVDELTLSLEYNKSRLTRDDTDLVAYDANIFSLRGTYFLNRFTFVRTRVDYDTLERRGRSQLLFGYTPNPGTAFYFGYNDDAHINGFNPFNLRPERGFNRNERTLFVKMSYLYRRNL